MHPKYTPKYIARFESRVDRSGVCHLWLAGKTSGGYGEMRVNGRKIGAHRISWELSRGPIPEGLQVLHDCPGGDNRACVNPDHLFLGTIADNMTDKTKKGRQATGERNGRRTHPEKFPKGDRHFSRSNPELLARGERNGRAKLTEVQVRAIRLLHYHGEYSLNAIAELFGVSAVMVGLIVRRKAWTHVA